MASALNDVTHELGAALGVALLGAVLSAGYRNAIDPLLDGVPSTTADTAREGIANARRGAPATSPRRSRWVPAALGDVRDAGAAPHTARGSAT